jgi:hypothetical protein
MLVVASLAASAAAVVPNAVITSTVTDKIGREARKSIILTFGPAVLDLYVLTVDITDRLQSLSKRVHAKCVFNGRSATKISYYRHDRPLGGCCERPRRGRTTN